MGDNIPSGDPGDGVRTPMPMDRLTGKAASFAVDDLSRSSTYRPMMDGVNGYQAVTKTSRHKLRKAELAHLPVAAHRLIRAWPSRRKQQRHPVPFCGLGTDEALGGPTNPRGSSSPLVRKVRGEGTIVPLRATTVGTIGRQAVDARFCSPGSTGLDPGSRCSGRTAFPAGIGELAVVTCFTLRATVGWVSSGPAAAGNGILTDGAGDDRR